MSNIILLLIVGIVARTEGTAPPAPPLNQVAVVSCTSVNIDIGFILDSSGSVGSHYQSEKNFIKSLAEAFGVSENGAHAGVVTFSDNAFISITLTQYKDISSFSTAVDSIPFIASGTRIDLGLEYGNLLLTEEYGGRDNVERLLVLLTDGQHGGGGNPVLLGENIRKSGINIVAIGIGSNVDITQLTAIAGAGNYYSASSFTTLTTQTFIEDMTKASCAVMYQPASEDGRFYKLHDDNANWDDSLAQCEREGAHLAIVDNDVTQHYMKQKYGSISIWIGAKYDVTSNRWVWVDGQPIDNDAYWGGVEPQGNNLCLTTNYIVPGLWNDTSCNQSFPFLCQKGAAKPKTPVLSCNASGNRIKYTCQIFRRTYSVPIVYEVTWIRSEHNGSPKEIYTETLDGRDVSYLQNNDTHTLYHLGVNIYCKVRTWYANQRRVKSVYAVSNTLLAGIKFEPASFNLLEGGSPVQLTVSLSVPLLCENGTTNCKVSVHLVSPNADIFLKPCYIVFHATEDLSATSKTVYVSTKSDLIDDGQRTINISPRILPSDTSDDWKNITDQTIAVTRISVSTGRCTSTGDPHIRTFDGTYFNHYRVGHYTLTESRSRIFQVHVGTHQCASVSCNCGVTVREGDDVLSVDMCKQRFAPQATYRSNKEPQRGTYIEQSHNGKTFILKFRSGAYVKFAARGWGSSYYADITVQLPPNDFNNTIGLCGLIDTYTGNDMSDKNGIIYHSSCGHQACAEFTESWRLSREQSLFYYRGGDMECLPDSESVSEEVGGDGDKCPVQYSSNNVNAEVTSGYRKMVFPGQLECDRKRNVPTDKDVIVCNPPDDDSDGPADVIAEPPVFQPIVPTFPTKSGITEQAANDYCQTQIEVSTAYQACKAVIGAEFLVNGYIEQCVVDIQILDDKPVALQSAMEAMKSDCEGVVLREPATWTIGDDGIPEPPSIVLDNLCPNECSRNGICSEGVCICDEGFVTEDCSVKADQVPRLEDFPCGRLCDIRKYDCHQVTVTSLDLVPGNVVCGFNESTRLDGGVFVTSPSSGLLSFSEAICELPKTNNVTIEHYHLSDKDGIPSQTYQVSLSNDGHNFSSSVLPFIVYDSKCMKCENTSTTCEEPKNCVLKENTCLIRGFCFRNGEADPKDERCMVCDPERSTSKFVYRRGNPLECKDKGYTLVCHNEYVTGVWEKDLFGAYHIEVSLNDPSCNTYQSNSTHFWTTANFKVCGSTIREDRHTILQENTAALRITYVEKNIIQKTVIYKYRMQCILDRSVNISTANYFTAIEKIGDNFTASGAAYFNASIDLYTSASFLMVPDGVVTVTSYEPVFVGIREMNGNEKLKFIVHQCFATPTSYVANVRYTFFDMKCPIDPSFKIVSTSTNHFNFQIDAFTFIEVRKSVYIHCQLYICTVNATSTPCTQTCHLRARRDIEEELPLKELSIQTDMITFQKKTTCNDITCSAYSRCIELYPAQCRCDEGHAFDGVKSKCSKDNTFSVRGLHIEQDFISTYSNASSVDFLRFAVEMEEKLTALFQSRGAKIVGVKVIGARPGSVVLDLLLMYPENSTAEEAIESFLSTVLSNKTELSNTSTGSRLKIKTHIQPTIILDKKRIEEDDTSLLIAATVPAVLVVFALILISMVMYKVRRKRNTKHIPLGRDNEGVVGDDVIVETSS